MERIKSMVIKAMPWLLIVFGFLSLNYVQPMFGFGRILVGIVIFIERRWPEKWGTESE